MLRTKKYFKGGGYGNRVIVQVGLADIGDALVEDADVVAVTPLDVFLCIFLVCEIPEGLTCKHGKRRYGSRGGRGLTDTIVRSFSFSSIGKLISSGCPDLGIVSSEILKTFYRKHL